MDADLDKSKITEAEVFSNDVTATASVMALYETFSLSRVLSGSSSMIAATALSANEITNVTQDASLKVFEEHSLISQNENIESLWNQFYNLIFQANAILEGIKGSNSLTASLADQLQGEALLMRAFSYFYLVNLFGEVPLTVQTDYHVNRLLSRKSIDDVYALIEEDLLAAQSLLPTTYITTNRVRPNRAAATALLARMYLYRGQYALAENHASEVIANSSYRLFTSADDISKLFLMDSPETIWQIMPVIKSLNTNEGQNFIIITAPVPGSNADGVNELSSALRGNFESNDKRSLHWIGSFMTSSTTYYFPFKYKKKSKDVKDPYTESSIILRLPEIYLIRAEARAHLGKLVGANSALSDLNAIRERVGIPESIANNEQDLLAAVEKERWCELFTEYGHRWFDLKRTGRAIEFLGNGTTRDDLLYPVPADEFIKNPNLGEQNSGY